MIKDTSMATDDGLQLNLPEQDLSRLSLGSDNPKKLQAWVDALPPLNLGESARQLYQYLQELNRLKLDFQKRLPLLEIIFPAIDHVCRGLGKHYLGQPLVLPEKARKVAALAQALQGHLANGYKLVAVQGLNKLNDRDVRQQVTLACYRAINALTNALVRCYQLYFPLPAKLWLEIHQLYLLAERHQLLDRQATQTEAGTPRKAYIGTLLLASARPNQLRQQETALIQQACGEWGAWVDVHMDQQREDLFAVDLNEDRGPQYGSQLTSTNAACRFIDTRQLVQRLSLRPEVAGLSLPKGMSASLLMHLRQAWGSLAERSFRRIGQDGHLELCMGLATVHYFLAGNQSFHHFMQAGNPQTLGLDGGNSNLFLNQQKSRNGTAVDDPWGQAYAPGAAIQGDFIDFSGIKSSLLQHDDDSSTPFDAHRVTKINASPGGYCLNWPGDTPLQLRAGELIALRDGHPEWAVGVIRWVRQLTSGGAEFGVEVMAPRAQPCGARPLRKTGEDANFLRALMLPALQAVGQPMTLLLPTVGFQVGQKVELAQNGEHSRLILTRQLSGTASYNLYMFRDATPEAEAPAANRDKTDDNKGQFDSIWSNL